MSAALAIALALICLAGGGLLGFLLGRGGGSEKKRAAALEQEFEDYKRNVTEHFGKTAEHFQSIGRQYRELYEHMASGASALCKEDDRTRLSFPSLLTIEAVAESDPDASPADEAAPAAPEAAADEGASAPEDETADAADSEPRAAAGEDEAAALAATDAADDEIRVEVDVEVVDDDAPDAGDDAIGAAPRAESADLDPSDDAKATRH